MRVSTFLILLGLVALALYETRRTGADFVRRAPDPADMAVGCGSVEHAGTLFLHPMFGDRNRLWKIDGAGTSCLLSEGIEGEPSREAHNGVHWFLTTKQLPDETYPDGSPRRELFLLDEDGRAVQLSDCPELEPLTLVARWPAHGCDTIVSWVARRWTPSGQIAEGGIYTARLRFNERGEVACLEAQPQAPCLSLPLVTDLGQPTGINPRVPDVCAYDWSPDGTQVVWETLDQQLMIARIASADARRLTDVRGCDPSWSPDGTTIVFKTMASFGAIATIRPDGSGFTPQVAGYPGRHIVFSPVFSPAGQLAHARMFYDSDPDIEAAQGVTTCVCTVDGEHQLQARLNIPPGLVPVAWRSDS